MSPPWYPIPLLIRNAARTTPRRVAPRSATKNARFAVTALPRRAVRRRPHVGVVPAVLDPFGHVAKHVACAEIIRRERTDGRRAAEAVVAVVVRPQELLVLFATGPVVHVCVSAAEVRVLTPEPRGCRTRPRRVLPLRLAGQPIGSSGLACEPADVFLGFEPTHLDRRRAGHARLSVDGTAPGATPVGDTGAPLGGRHLIAA